MGRLVSRPNPKGWFLGLFLSTILLLLIAPLFLRGVVANLLLQGCFNVLILLTMYALSTFGYVMWTGIALAVPFCIFNWLGIFYHSLPLMAASYAFFCLFLLMAIIFLTYDLFDERTINNNLMFGALMIYLLAGILWSKLFWLSGLLFPGSFHGVAKLEIDAVSLEAALSNVFEMLYYSFTVITTLGIGDIQPVHHLVKALTLLEAIFGQLFVAVAIARMVSVWKPQM
jgi:hypothetical protein